MNKGQDLLSSLTIFSKYARYWPSLGRRETFEEVVARNRDMHRKYFSERLSEDKFRELEPLIDEAFVSVRNKEVLPSMRMMQFSGEAVLRNHVRGYNCSALSVSDPAFFRELMFLLLSGTGVGFSVQKQHISQLPDLVEPGPTMRYVVQDSIVGWSDAVDQLAQAYFHGAPYPDFDFVEIRAKGEPLKISGGKAPGPEPLKKSLKDINRKFSDALFRNGRLRPIDAHDIACFISEAVLAGGIRRAAMISLFSPDDEEMMVAKDGAWWENHPQRAYSNNSVVLLRGRDDEYFHTVFDHAQNGGSGEPGVSWTDDTSMLANPCHEIALKDMQFCNLSTIHAGSVASQQDLNQRARASAILGTLQAAYTNFHYLRPEWKKNSEEEALLGVSMTGIASGNVLGMNLEEAAANAVATNQEVAEIIGINPAARLTTIKPEGSGSLVLGTASGIHAWFDDYYIRRMRFNKVEPIAQYLMDNLPYNPVMNEDDPEIVEDDWTNPNQIVLSVPVKAPDAAITRDEGAISLLERVRRFHSEWIVPGNNWGGMTNNVSTTVNMQPDETQDVRTWMWNNRYHYNGITVLDYDGGTYKQMPFESITEEQYHKMAAKLENVDLRNVVEDSDETALASELACFGGACEINLDF